MTTPPGSDGSPTSLPRGTAEVRTRALAVAALTCIGFMLLGSLFGWLTGTEVDPTWYEALVRPEFEPPAVLVLAVHIFYYPLFFVLIYRALAMPHDRATRRSMMALILAAMAINTAWNPFFIGLHAPGLGAAGTALLLAAVAALAALLRDRDRLGALLLLPYLAWVIFDLIWALQLVRLNP